MNSREIAYLILRIFALYIITISFAYPLELALMYLESTSVGGNINALTALLSAVPLLVGIYLWIYTKKIIPHFVLGTQDVQTTGDSLNILKTSLIIMGVYIVITKIPFILSNIYFFNNEVSLVDKETQISIYASYLNASTSNIISILFGLSLIIGNKFYLLLLKRFI